LFWHFHVSPSPYLPPSLSLFAFQLPLFVWSLMLWWDGGRQHWWFPWTGRFLFYFTSSLLSCETGPLLILLHTQRTWECKDSSDIMPYKMTNLTFEPRSFWPPNQAVLPTQDHRWK
jgi:hypothetical protein